MLYDGQIVRKDIHRRDKINKQAQLTATSNFGCGLQATLNCFNSATFTMVVGSLPPHQANRNMGRDQTQRRALGKKTLPHQRLIFILTPKTEKPSAANKRDWSLGARSPGHPARSHPRAPGADGGDLMTSSKWKHDIVPPTGTLKQASWAGEYGVEQFCLLILPLNSPTLHIHAAAETRAQMSCRMWQAVHHHAITVGDKPTVKVAVGNGGEEGL